jgi:hypothetical protein
MPPRPRRLSVFYTPNGMMMDQFRPGPGATTLEPLNAFKDRMTVITGLGHPQAAPMGDLNAGHGRSCPAFLTGTHVRQTEGTDIRCAISVDQVYARHLGDATQLSSLETGIDQPSLLGSCDIGYSCAYTNGISWMSPTVPLPVAANPRDVFERLFGDGDALDAQSRMAQMRRQTSILDFVREDAQRLTGQLGMEDRRKLDEYLTATRDIEKRIQRAASTPLADAGSMERPAGIPDSFDAHVKLMVDLQVLAFQADITRRHLHDRARNLQPHLSRDRRARQPPYAQPPRAYGGKEDQAGADQPPPHGVLRLSAEAHERDQGWRCEPAGSILRAARLGLWRSQ